VKTDVVALLIDLYSFKGNVVCLNAYSDGSGLGADAV
jgi:hypothetical protein